MTPREYSKCVREELEKIGYLIEFPRKASYANMIVISPNGIKYDISVIFCADPDKTLAQPKLGARTCLRPDLPHVVITNAKRIAEKSKQSLVERGFRFIQWKPGNSEFEALWYVES